MPRRLFYFDPPDRFVAGTVGEPGQRTFFLQARKASQVVSVVLEKVQVQVLAERLDQLLDELEERGVTEPTSEEDGADTGPLDEPLVEAFRATTLTLGWDADAGLVLVEARAEPIEVEIEAVDDDDDAEDDEAEEAGAGDDDEEGSVSSTHRLQPRSWPRSRRPTTRTGRTSSASGSQPRPPDHSCGGPPR